MKQNVLIFVPNTLKKGNPGLLEGFRKFTTDCHSFFITNNVILKHCKSCIGFVSDAASHGSDAPLLLDISRGRCKLFGLDNPMHCSINEIIYDFKAFKNSDVIDNEDDNYGVHIKALTEKLSESRSQGYYDRKLTLNMVLDCSLFAIGLILQVFHIAKPLTKQCATLSHFEDRLKTAEWFANTLRKEKKFSPRIGNALVATTLDLLLGMFLVNFCLQHRNTILEVFENVGKSFLGNLKHLLVYLMGSPIGLKLNHAFNNSLGMFFFYHINLWRIFLQATRPLLNEYFLFLVLPAVLGVSFQFAMLIDIVSMMTFHVYCIYVYAARLFSLQVKGLVSLWRLFIGRKHNPLRNRVDSCEYSPNQLFIGTLGFTILLFLLPTTTMYYIVFATFRMTTLLFNNLLASLKNFFNALPLYVIFLWICNSPSVAGSLYIKWNDCDGKNIQIEAKLSSLSLTKSLQKFKPGPKKSAPRTPLGNIVRHFFTGTLV